MLEVGEQTLFGKIMLQSWSALYMLEQFLTEHKFEIIIELGTSTGALAMFFSQHAPTFSFDIQHPTQYTPSYCFVERDIFKKHTMMMIIELIAKKKALIFCDDGNKPRELKMYSKFIDEDDFLLVHDYNRPDGVKLDDLPYCLETYRQNEWDKMETYILCTRLRKL